MIRAVCDVKNATRRAHRHAVRRAKTSGCGDSLEASCRRARKCRHISRQRVHLENARREGAHKVARAAERVCNETPGRRKGSAAAGRVLVRRCASARIGDERADSRRRNDDFSDAEIKSIGNVEKSARLIERQLSREIKTRIRAHGVTPWAEGARRRARQTADAPCRKIDCANRVALADVERRQGRIYRKPHGGSKPRSSADVVRNSRCPTDAGDGLHLERRPVNAPDAILVSHVQDLRRYGHTPRKVQFRIRSDTVDYALSSADVAHPVTEHCRADVQSPQSAVSEV